MFVQALNKIMHVKYFMQSRAQKRSMNGIFVDVIIIRMDQFYSFVNVQNCFRFFGISFRMSE